MSSAPGSNPPDRTVPEGEKPSPAPSPDVSFPVVTPHPPTHGTPRNHKITQNTIANSAFTVVTALAQLIVLPILISYWSKPKTGEWSVLWAMPALLWCLEGGLAGLAGSKATLALAAGDHARARSIVGTILCLQLFVLAAINIVGISILYGTNIQDRFTFHYISHSQVRAVLFIALLYLSAGFTLTLVKGVYIATDNAARGTWLAVASKALEVAAFASVVPLGGNPATLAWFLVVPASIAVLYGYFDLSRRQKDIRLSIRDINRVEVINSVRDGFPALASQLATILNLEGITIAVFLALGPAAVVTVTSVRTVSRLIFQVVQIVNVSVFPEISRAFGSANFPMLRAILEQSSRKIVWLSVISTSGLMLFGGPVISHWTRGTVRASPAFLALFALAILIQSAWSAFASALMATNRHHAFSLRVCVTNAFVLGLTYLLCRFIGENGVPTAALVGDIFLIIAAWNQFRRILPDDLSFRLSQSLKLPVWNR